MCRCLWSFNFDVGRVISPTRPGCELDIEALGALMFLWCHFCVDMW